MVDRAHGEGADPTSHNGAGSPTALPADAEVRPPFGRGSIDCRESSSHFEVPEPSVANALVAEEGRWWEGGW